MTLQYFQINSKDKISQVCEEVKLALKQGMEPEKSSKGSFQVFFLKDRQGSIIAVFKPEIINNQNINEYCAYLLDYKNFAGIPETIITSLDHPLWEGRSGILQLFKSGAHLCRGETYHFDASSVRRIALLDMRLLNLDRNIDNLLLSQNRCIPIDHNLVLPEYFGGCFFVWMDWEEAKTPFSVEEKAYVDSIHPEIDRELLLSLGIHARAANFYFFATRAVQIGVSLGFTAYELGCFFQMRKWQSEDQQQHWEQSIVRDVIRSVGYKDNTNFLPSIEPFLQEIQKVFKQSAIGQQIEPSSP